VKQVLLTGFAAVALLVLPAAMHAKIAVPQPPHPAVRVALADCIIVGKVVSIEEKPVDALPTPGAKDKIPYTVAVVKVDEAVAGAKGLTHVRVAFQPPGQGRFGPFRFQLAKDQEVCLVLQSHFDGPFYTATYHYDAIDKKTSGEAYDKQVNDFKKYVKLLADPKAGLTSKVAQERLETAAMLLAKYRTARPSAAPAKTEAVDTEQSKLILQALAEADWMNRNPVDYRLTPLNLFQQLGLTDKDGWTPPKNFKEFPEAAQKWLKENAGKYRIQRFVHDDKKDK
jgi:hypothetical protein